MKRIEMLKKLVLENKLETLMLVKTFPLRVAESFKLIRQLESSGEPLKINDGLFPTLEEEAKLLELDYKIKLKQFKEAMGDE